MSGLSPRNWGRSRRKFSGENAPVFCFAFTAEARRRREIPKEVLSEGHGFSRAARSAKGELPLCRRPARSGSGARRTAFKLLLIIYRVSRRQTDASNLVRDRRPIGRPLDFPE